jgi:hypothetical protein
MTAFLYNANHAKVSFENRQVLVRDVDYFSSCQQVGQSLSANGIQQPAKLIYSCCTLENVEAIPVLGAAFVSRVSISNHLGKLGKL